MAVKRTPGQAPKLGLVRLLPRWGQSAMQRRKKGHASATPEQHPRQTMSEDTMKKTLIVFHSRSGYTRRVAQALAQRLDADLDEIRIVQPMAGTLGYAFCALESLLHLTPALRPSTRDAADYPLVVVGTPVWFWNLSSPVRSWLAGNRLAKGRFAFFCTMGGSGAGRAFAAMQELAGGAPRATLALTDGQIDAGADAAIDAFVRALRAAPSAATAPAAGAHQPA